MVRYIYLFLIVDARRDVVGRVIIILSSSVVMNGSYGNKEKREGGKKNQSTHALDGGGCSHQKDDLSRSRIVIIKPSSLNDVSKSLFYTAIFSIDDHFFFNDF